MALAWLTLTSFNRRWQNAPEFGEFQQIYLQSWTCLSPQNPLLTFCMKNQFLHSPLGTFIGYFWSNPWSWLYFGPDPGQRSWRVRISQHCCCYGKSITSFKHEKESPVSQQLEEALLEQRPRNSKIFSSSQTASKARVSGKPWLVPSATTKKFNQPLTTTAPAANSKIILMFSHLTIYTRRTEIPDFRMAKESQNN